METAEIIFNSLYLISVITMGIIMIIKSKGRKQILLFGIMAVILGLGDSFHLVPRIYALRTDGLENHYEALGFGTFVASISMTIFYVILYHIAKIRYGIKNKILTVWIYFLAIARILLCFNPGNEWTSQDPSWEWGVYRNIPFLILGILIVVLFYRETIKTNDHPLKWMWLALSLSFAFYLPVVLFSGLYPPIGALMIPKTLAYVWVVIMGMRTMRETLPN